MSIERSGAGLMALMLFLTAAMRGAIAEPALSKIDRDELAEMGAKPVFAVIHHEPRAGARVIETLGLGAWKFDFVDAVMARTPAEKLLVLAAHAQIRDIEIVDDAVAQEVRDLLVELSRVKLYEDIGAFRLSVLNISIGPPKELVNRNRSSEKTVRRALAKIVHALELPVVLSAGNDGPIAGRMNPWAKADGVIAVGATDVNGMRVWSDSSYPLSYSDESSWHFFVAHGEKTVGPLASGAVRTPRMLEDEKEVDLAAIVGPENVDSFSVRSGTSFAAGNLSRTLCHAHQMMELIRGFIDASAPLRHQMKPFVRGYIDSGIDRDHPAFEKRLVDSRYHYSGLQIQISAERKRHLFNVLAGNAIDIRLRYTPDFAFRFLKRIARQVQGATPNQIGFGFVDNAAALQLLSEARYSTLIELFTPEDEPRRDKWLNAVTQEGDSLLFSADEVERIAKYCQDYDLILALSIGR